MKDGSSGAERRERLRMCKEVEISIEMKMGKRMWTWRDTGQRMSDARNRTSCDPKLHAAPVPATLHRAFVATVVVCGTWKAARACTRQTARSTAVHWKVVERPSSPRLLIIPCTQTFVHWRPSACQWCRGKRPGNAGGTGSRGEARRGIAGGTSGAVSAVWAGYKCVIRMDVSAEEK